MFKHACEAVVDADNANTFTCAVCLLLVRDPVITECDHVFCQPCLNQWMTRSDSDRQATCPTDRKSLVDVKTGISTVKPITRGSLHHRTLGNIRVHCPVNRDVCTWTGRYSEADAHADNCPYSFEVCIYCQSKLPKRTFSTHTCAKSQIVKETKARLYVGAWVTYRSSVVFPMQYARIASLGTLVCTADSFIDIAYEHINTISPTDPRPAAPAPAPLHAPVPMSVEANARALCAATRAYAQDDGSHVPTLAEAQSYWTSISATRRADEWSAIRSWSESSVQRWNTSYLTYINRPAAAAPAPAAAGGGGSANTFARAAAAYTEWKDAAAAGGGGSSARVAAVVARAAAAFSDSKEAKRASLNNYLEDVAGARIQRAAAGAGAGGGGSALVDDFVEDETAARRRRASAGAAAAAAAQSMIDDDDTGSDDDDDAPSAADEKKAAERQRKKVAFRVQDNSIHQFRYTEMKAAKSFLMENGYVVVKLPEAILPDDKLLFKYLSTLGTGIRADDDVRELTRQTLPGAFDSGIINGVLYARPGGNGEKGGATKTATSGVGQSEVAWTVRSHPYTRALFEEFTGETDLRTGFDSINLFVKGVHKTEKSWPHVDVNKHAYQKTAEDAGCSWDVQSIYNTRPTTEGSGGLVVYPGTHKYHANVIARAHAEKSKRNFIPVNKNGNEPQVEGVTPLLVTSDPHTFTFWLSPLIHYAATGKEVHRTRGTGDRILRFGVYVSLSPAKIAEPYDDVRIAMIKKGLTTNHAAHDPVAKSRARYARPKWNFEISDENPTRKMIHFTPAMLALVAPKAKWQFIQAGDYSDIKERAPVAAAASSSSSAAAAAAASTVGYPTAAAALQHAMTMLPEHEGNWKTERLPSGGWKAYPIADDRDYKVPAAAAAAAGGGGRQPNYLRDELPAAAAGGDYTSSSSGDAAGPRRRRPPTPVPTAAAAAGGGGANRRKRESSPRVEVDDDADYSDREQDDDFKPEEERERISPSQRKRAKREPVYSPAASPVYSPSSPTYSPTSPDYSPSSEDADRAIEAAAADENAREEANYVDACLSRRAIPAAAAAVAAPKPAAIDLTVEPDSCSEYQSSRAGKSFQSCPSCTASASLNCRAFATFFQLTMAAAGDTKGDNFEQLMQGVDLRITPKPREVLRADAVVCDTRVLATKAITKGTIVYQGESIFQYRQPSDSTKGLCYALNALSESEKRSILEYTDDLYPNKLGDTIMTFKAHYPSCKDPIALVGRFEQLIVSRAIINNFHHGDIRRVYQTGSKFNHSCVPNCTWQTVQSCLVVRASRDIKAGEELTHSYFDNPELRTDDVAARQKIIEREGEFVCACLSCTGKTQEKPFQNRDNAMKPFCNNCGGDERELLRCAKCKVAVYCSPVCQKEHWKLLHKRNCRCSP